MTIPDADPSTAAVIRAALNVQRELGFESAHTFLLSKGIDSTQAMGLLRSSKDEFATVDHAKRAL